MALGILGATCACIGLVGSRSTSTTYHKVAAQFHRYHQHDLNCALHFLTTTLGVWGVVHLWLDFCGTSHYQNFSENQDDPMSNTIWLYQYAASFLLVDAYTMLVALTTPAHIAVVHTAVIVILSRLLPSPYQVVVEPFLSEHKVVIDTVQPWMADALAIALGFGLQDLAHWLCAEPTFLGSYWQQDGSMWMLCLHNFWLLPLVLDSIFQRHLFLPYVPCRNRTIRTNSVTSRASVELLREWIRQNVAFSEETTHIWPHAQSATDKAVTALEHDSAIRDAFRTVFPAKHYDVQPVQGMNEIYVTAVGSKKSINSDAVFYTSHTDGPYWFLPGASLYRVLVGVTPNTQVRTRFTLQHSSQDQVLDQYGMIGFDYNRELHWIDHVPGAASVNTERRSVIKLHYVVYPKSWHRYGQWCAYLNTSYNTWARGNFLQTLRPAYWFDHVLAWWIWLVTRGNAALEEYVGWNNVMYIVGAYLLSGCDTTSGMFVIATSFRHYVLYMTTFAYRTPPVALGNLMRDAKLYKTISMLHLARSLVPVALSSGSNMSVDGAWVGIGLTLACFSVTVLATARLGLVRTYFGAELGFVQPCWIDGFPYGYVPHPMILGQLSAYAVIGWWWRAQLVGSIETSNAVLLLAAHATCYTVHLIQEILTSSYK